MGDPNAPISDVHVLLHGRPLCGFDNRVPREWPDGHRWTSVLEPEPTTCVTCQQRLPEATEYLKSTGQIRVA